MSLSNSRITRLRILTQRRRSLVAIIIIVCKSRLIYSDSVATFSSFPEWKKKPLFARSQWIREKKEKERERRLRKFKVEDFVEVIRSGNPGSEGNGFITVHTRARRLLERWPRSLRAASRKYHFSSSVYPSYAVLRLRKPRDEEMIAALGLLCKAVYEESRGFLEFKMIICEFLMK